MKNCIKIVLLFFVMSAVFFSQDLVAVADTLNEEYTEEIVEDSLENDIIVIESDSSPGDVVLPDEVDLSVDKYFPPIRKQVGNCCSAWATTYYQFTYEVARLNDWDAKNNDSYVFSPRYTWSFYNDGKGFGATIYECYSALSKFGSLKWSDYPQTEVTGEWYQGETYEETVETLREALKYRLSNIITHKYAALGENTSSAPIITSNKDEKLYDMKLSLFEGHPLVIGTYEDGFNYERLTNNNEFICTYMTYKTGFEGHAMTIVGYDDNIWYDLNGDNEPQEYEKGAFKVANSWGDSYKNQGYIWILYDALNRCSNVDKYNVENRSPVFTGSEAKSINVQEYSLDVTVEVTLNFKSRGNIGIELAASDYEGNKSDYMRQYYNFGGDVNGSGGTDYESHTFVLDYSKWFDMEDSYYWVRIGDPVRGDDHTTTIEKVRWVDSYNRVLKEFTDQGSYDGKFIELNSYIPVTNVSFQEEYKQFYKYDEVFIQASVVPYNASKKDLVWTSGNENVAIVDDYGRIEFVGTGTTLITVTTTDGTNMSASCIVEVNNDYNRVSVDSKYDNIIDFSEDADYYEFIAQKDGKYIINSEGYTDTIVYVYDSNNNLIAYNDDYSEEGYYNFEVVCELSKYDTYYIKVTAPSGDMGDYKIAVRYAYDEYLTCDVCECGRTVSIEGKFASVFDTIDIKLGENTYTISRPANLSDVDITINGVRFCVVFTKVDEYYINWDIEAYIPVNQDTVTEDIECTLSQGDLTVFIDLSRY